MYDIPTYYEEKLKATWSPEQIACTPCELKMPSWRTIYRWIYEKYLVSGKYSKGKSMPTRTAHGRKGRLRTSAAY